MKSRVYPLIIVILAALFCGCKDKEESQDADWDEFSINLLSEEDGITIIDCNFVEPNEQLADYKTELTISGPGIDWPYLTFTFIVCDDLKTVSFSYKDGEIICDSTKSEFMEIIPYYIYWQLKDWKGEEPNEPIIRWAEPNEVKE